MVDSSSTMSEESFISLTDEYSLGLKFFKEKEGKAFYLRYADRLKLCAYVKQIKYGPCDSKNAPDVGFLDVVGSNRRDVWRQLGDLDPEDAKRCFLELLDDCCPLWAPYLEAHRREAEEKERRRQEEERRRKEEEAAAEAKAQQEAASWAQALSAADAQRRMLQESLLQHWAQIRAALNQQTIDQFRQYAEQQHPSDKAKQEELIRQLQEQHFQQYISQVYRQQLQRQRVQYPKPGRTKPEDGAGGLAQNGINSGSASDSQSVSDRADFSPKENGFDYAPHLLDGLPPSPGGAQAGPPTSPSELPPLTAASMWTRKDVQDFKAGLAGDKEGMLTVGSGECVTIRVPTHDEGTFISWEFATDSYDIGFGLFFEWTHSASPDMTVHVSRGGSEDEAEDEEDGEEEKGRPDQAQEAAEALAPTPAQDGPTTANAKAHPNQQQQPAAAGTAEETEEGPIVDEIIPIYRRDSQNEVYCGSHQYPGRGVYLLKFDNSYSLWRSKALYYRVFYTR